MDDWVLDCLVGFLKSPTWSQAISSFTDTHCGVFDPGEENKFSYTDIHKEYKKLVEELLEKITSELGISGDQFIHACSLIQTSKQGQENEELFDQVLAADDFLLFKGNMVRRNIDLELQALNILREQIGHSPRAYDKDSTTTTTTTDDDIRRNRSEKEEKELEEAVKLSAAQYELEHSMDEEKLQKMIEQAKRESLQLYQQQQTTVASAARGTMIEESGGAMKAKHQEDPVSDPKHRAEDGDPLKQNANTKVQNEKTEQVEQKAGSLPQPLTMAQKSSERESSTPPEELEKLPPLSAVKDLSLSHQQESGKDDGRDTKDVGVTSDAMTTWLETAKSGLMGGGVSSTSSSKSHLHHNSQNTAGPTPEQLREREIYLKRQRDHLLEAKRKQRSSNQSRVGVANSSRQGAAAGSSVSETDMVARTGGGKKGKTTRGGKDTGILSSAIARHIKKV